MNLEGKTVLVTGSSRGIGAATAKHLASLGMKVAVTYSRSPEKAEKVFSQLSGEGHLCLQLNVSDEDSVKEAFEKIKSEFGSLYGLVNNAGITRDQLLLRMKPEDFDDVISTNLRGCFLCSKMAVKLMLKSKEGSIVNITSVVGQAGSAGQSNYASSKAGAEAFSKSLAQEVGARSIRVNSVAPGYIVTDMTEALSDDQKDGILSKVPLKTLGEPIDVAHSVAFLLSEKAKYITGQTLSVNGGMYM